MPTIERALARGQHAATLKVVVPRSTVASIDRFLELLDLADAFCRAERLLSLARSRDQRRFQEWFFGEFVRQPRASRRSRGPRRPRGARASRDHAGQARQS